MNIVLIDIESQNFLFIFLLHRWPLTYIYTNTEENQYIIKSEN